MSSSSEAKNKQPNPDILTTVTNMGIACKLIVATTTGNYSYNTPIKGLSSFTIENWIDNLKKPRTGTSVNEYFTNFSKDFRAAFDNDKQLDEYYAALGLFCHTPHQIGLAHLQRYIRMYPRENKRSAKIKKYCAPLFLFLEKNPTIQKFLFTELASTSRMLRIQTQIDEFVRDLQQTSEISQRKSSIATQDLFSLPNIRSSSPFERTLSLSLTSLPDEDESDHEDMDDKITPLVLRYDSQQMIPITESDLDEQETIADRIKKRSRTKQSQKPSKEDERPRKRQKPSGERQPPSEAKNLIKLGISATVNKPEVEANNTIINATIPPIEKYITDLCKILFCSLEGVNLYAHHYLKNIIVVDDPRDIVISLHPSKAKATTICIRFTINKSNKKGRRKTADLIKETRAILNKKHDVSFTKKQLQIVTETRTPGKNLKELGVFLLEIKYKSDQDMLRQRWLANKVMNKLVSKHNKKIQENSTDSPSSSSSSSSYAM